WQEAEFLTSFNRGTCEHDAVHLFLHQRLHRHRHCQIRLAGAGDTDAKHDVAILDRLNVLPLIRRLRRDLFFTGRVETGFSEVIAQAESAVFGDLSEGFAQLFVGEVFSFLEEVGKVFEDALGGLDIGGVAVDGNVLTAGINSYVQQRLQILDVLVMNTKQRLQTTRRQLNFLQTFLTFSFTDMLPQSGTKCTNDSGNSDFLSPFVPLFGQPTRLDTPGPDLYTPSL